MFQGFIVIHIHGPKPTVAFQGPKPTVSGVCTGRFRRGVISVATPSAPTLSPAAGGSAAAVRLQFEAPAIIPRELYQRADDVAS